MNAYLVELNNRTKIQIDEDELMKVMNSIDSGSSVFLKKGIIANPNHIVDIVLDTERIGVVNEYNRINGHAIGLGTEKPKRLQPLLDDFAEMKSKMKQLRT